MLYLTGFVSNRYHMSSCPIIADSTYCYACYLSTVKQTSACHQLAHLYI